MSWRGVLFLVLSLALAGCSASYHTQVPPEALQIQAAEVSARAAYRPYVLRPNDQVRVLVYNDTNISGDYHVDAGGFVSIPLAGRVKASGLTPAQLESAITARLSNVIQKPSVNVQVANYAMFYIHGEVKRSGEFPYRPGLTVMDAVASAGGFTYRADESKAHVRRAGTDAEGIYSLDARVPIFPGDNIRIPERFF